MNAVQAAFVQQDLCQTPPAHLDRSAKIQASSRCALQEPTAPCDPLRQACVCWASSALSIRHPTTPAQQDLFAETPALFQFVLQGRIVHQAPLHQSRVFLARFVLPIHPQSPSVLLDPTVPILQRSSLVPAGIRALGERRSPRWRVPA